ncbi:L-rhamnose isomerase [Pelomyxa schiedti]|nr:L-rhamnose isomerase [Pelomyxa schiedti]
MSHSPGTTAIDWAKAAYAKLGVDVDAVLVAMQKISLSIPCWQGDDVGGFEHTGAALSGGGIAVTGAFPGKARCPDELRQDAEFAFGLIPGKHRFNLHAIYGDFSRGFLDRDAITIQNFEPWIAWASRIGIALDFNPTLFSHPKAADNFTLTHPNDAIRSFWIEHVKHCRTIAAEIGRRLGSPCVNNLWIPDGFKDLPVDRIGYRQRLVDSLDVIYKEKLPANCVRDSVEGKLFGIGAESFTVGSHDFYLGYAVKNGLMLCMDTGHFHPTESVADKISSTLLCMDEILIHMSRPVRWDSDHVCILDESVTTIAEEIVRAEAISRVHVALDYFDGSINRVGAWVIGARSVLKAFLMALLQPHSILKEMERSGKYFERLALLEELKSMPWGAVWNQFCKINHVPRGNKWIAAVSKYERDVQAPRSRT